MANSIDDIVESLKLTENSAALNPNNPAAPVSSAGARSVFQITRATFDSIRKLPQGVNLPDVRFEDLSLGENEGTARLHAKAIVQEMIDRGIDKPVDIASTYNSGKLFSKGRKIEETREYVPRFAKNLEAVSEAGRLLSSLDSEGGAAPLAFPRIELPSISLPIGLQGDRSIPITSEPSNIPLPRSIATKVEEFRGTEFDRRQFDDPEQAPGPGAEQSEAERLLQAIDPNFEAEQLLETLDDPIGAREQQQVQETTQFTEENPNLSFILGNVLDSPIGQLARTAQREGLKITGGLTDLVSEAITGEPGQAREKSLAAVRGRVDPLAEGGLAQRQNTNLGGRIAGGVTRLAGTLPLLKPGLGGIGRTAGKFAGVEGLAEAQREGATPGSIAETAAGAGITGGIFGTSFKVSKALFGAGRVPQITTGATTGAGLGSLGGGDATDITAEGGIGAILGALGSRRAPNILKQNITRQFQVAGREFAGKPVRGTKNAETFEDFKVGVERDISKLPTEASVRANAPAQTKTPGVPPEARPNDTPEKASVELLDNSVQPRLTDQQINDQIQRAEAQIDFGADTLAAKLSSFRQALSELDSQRAARRFYQLWFDRFYPLKTVRAKVEKKVGRKIEPEYRPDELARFSANKSRALTRYRIEKNDVDENMNVVGPSLAAILRPVLANSPRNAFGFKRHRETFREWVAYAAMKRALGLELRGKKSGFFDEHYKLDEGQALVANLEKRHPEWAIAAEQFSQWTRNTVGFVVRAGGLNQTEAELFTELNPIYLPFSRVMEDIPGRSGRGSSKPFKRFKGSEKIIKGPISQLLEDTARMHELADRMRVIAGVADLAGRPGAAGSVRFIKNPTQKTTLTMKRLRADLQQIGIEVPEASLDNFINVFQLVPDGSLPRNQFSVRVPGKNKAETVRRTIEVDSHIFDAIEGLPPRHLGTAIGNIASGPESGVISAIWPVGRLARLNRLGATQANPLFGVFRNPVRDLPVSAVFGRNPWMVTMFPQAWGVVQDLGASARPSLFPQTARAQARGMFASGLGGQDRSVWMQAQDDLINKAAGRRVVYVMRHPVDAVRALFSPFEMGPRMGEFNGRMKQNRRAHPNWSDRSVFIRSFNEGQDVTLNFSGGGLISQQYNQMTSFFNASMLGPDKLARTFNERPTETFLKAFLIMTPFALAKWYENKDDPEYQNMPTAYKIGNTMHRTEEGNWIRTPIPFDLGIIFMSMPVAMADYYYTREPIFRDHMDAVGENLIKLNPFNLPNILSPKYDVDVNENYLGNPIVSDGMRRLPVNQRTRSHTTDLAKAVSEAAGKFGMEWDPIALDYMLWNYTGGLPRLIPGGDVDQPADIGFSFGGLFLRDPASPKRQANVFFNEFTRLEQLKTGQIIEFDDEVKLRVLRIYLAKSISPKFKEIRELREEGGKQAVINSIYRELRDDFNNAFIDAGYEGIFQ